MPVISFGLELSCELQEPKESLSVRKPPPVLYTNHIWETLAIRGHVNMPLERPPIIDLKGF